MAFADWRLGRQPALDGIRAVAAIAVLLDHTGLPGFEGGGLGVDVFFTLSGFLITNLLLEEYRATGRVALASFWVHRSLRLMPSVIALVVVIIIGQDYVVRGTEKGILPTLLYWTNWHRAYLGDVGALGHTWSLAIEEQFYILWPVLLLLVLRRPDGLRKALDWTVLLVIVIVTVREIHWQSGAVSADRIYNGLDYRGDALLIGCALALAAHTGRIPAWLSNPRNAIALLWALGFVFAGREVWGAPVYLERTVAALATAALIVAVMTGSLPRVSAALSHPVMRWLGLRSYAIYLWHYPVCTSVRGELYYTAPIEVVLSIGLAALSYQVVEVPFQRIRARLRRYQSRQSS